jgi:hypothetical protein
MGVAPPSSQSKLLARIARLRLVPIACLGAAVITALGVAGVLHLQDTSSLRLFDLDAKETVPAAWSAVLLLGAGIVFVSDGIVRAGDTRGLWLLAGGLFVFMAVEEWAAIHEGLEQRVGTDWQELYLPIFLLAGGVGLLLFRHLRVAEHAGALFVAGGAAWVVAQILEQLESSGGLKNAGYTPMMVAKELLEMIGSLLFLLAGLTALRAVARSRERSSRPVFATASEPTGPDDELTPISWHSP